jgi:hypothetical protein
MVCLVLRIESLPSPHFSRTLFPVLLHQLFLTLKLINFDDQLRASHDWERGGKSCVDFGHRVAHFLRKTIKLW